MRAGVIVAGGRSTRFGDSDKAVADLAGTPMVRRVADRLGEAVDELVVNCREDQVEAIDTALSDHTLEPTFALDEDPDQGPMAGIATGLGAVDSEYAAVVACDMPFVDPTFVDYLFERAASHEAAVPRPDEWFQTTQAVYHADAMHDACQRALERGEHKIVEPLFDLEYVVVEREDVLAHTSLDTFKNLNTREEFEAAAERF
ncbi:molybdenum cofactor guanylyltransferase [Haloarcula quadrata]|jgi:molybdopterin-guanine dinucleotide biosynthesis protein A|uniref:Probable molybdenum cofactor guanylyltransferase n=2 Tax=Haloarcula TaxID=2237 RepID=Q5V2K2_HALMA|nr:MULTISPECIES: molybdenum cofactor guanylyltransferase [Haloarcula]AAV46250.1 molybdopterin-guanine dinucleotide biosynthesis protein A [Haloarcula marismortui ATCC 43049]QCP90997.1 molybdenum cofactor guanylyltransferase [Haloarcula marismortui ATCC 43049]RKS82998.1 molybdenum cofactor guanylyltransferase [Haloarcula quadrata]